MWLKCTIHIWISQKASINALYLLIEMDLTLLCQFSAQSRSSMLHPNYLGLASESFRASYTVCPGPWLRQHQSTSSFQTIDLAYHVIPTQQASTTLQRAGSSSSWPTASSHIQSQEVPSASRRSQVKEVHLSTAPITYCFSTVADINQSRKSF